MPIHSKIYHHLVSVSKIKYDSPNSKRSSLLNYINTLNTNNQITSKNYAKNKIEAI